MADRYSEYAQIKEHITQQIVEITAHYGQGQVRKEGSRVIFRCPTCQKDKLTANPDWHGGPITGCWSYECSVPNGLNAVDFIAHMEGLDPKSQYKMVLDEGNRITAAPLLEAHDRLAEKRRSKTQASSPSNVAGAPGHDGENPSAQEEDPTLTDSVYRRLITSCGLTPEAWRGLENRGLTKQTVLDAGIGYIRADKAQIIMKSLHDEFGDDLARVPGFYPKEQSATGYWCNFAGKNLILFPYHDSKGLIRTVEGRLMFGEEHTKNYKYLSLTNSGSHLYVYPGMGFDNIEAFCEGLFGAILAAQDGFCVASIQGFRRYRARGGRYPLPELQGMDFAGRTIAYIPDMDSPPNPEVANEAPEAASWLIERQGGSPIIALLPSGKDLDEYLLMFQPQKRRRAFAKLIELSSYTLEEYPERIAADQRSADAIKADENKTDNIQSRQSAPRRKEDPEDDETSTSEENTGEPPKGQTQPPAQNSNDTKDTEDAEDSDHIDYVDHIDQHDSDGSNNQPECDSQDETQNETQDRTQDQPRHQPQDQSNHEPGQDDEDDEGTEEDQELNNVAPASQLTGEQFYRQDLSFPEDPPDPKTALGGTGGEVGEEEDSTNKERWHRRLKHHLKHHLTRGALAIAKSAARTAFKLGVLFAALYVTLIILFALMIPGEAFEGMWKWLALTIIICALLRMRLRSKQGRFKAGKISPGARG